MSFESLYSLCLSACVDSGLCAPQLSSALVNDLFERAAKRGKRLTVCEQLTRVCVSSKVSDSAELLRELLQSPPVYLTSLTLCSVTSLNAASVRRVLTSFPLLEELCLEECQQIGSDDVFADVATQLPALRMAHLNQCRRLGDNTLRHFLLCPQLEDLSVHGFRLTNNGIINAVQGARCRSTLARLSFFRANKMQDSAVSAMADAFGESLMALELLCCFDLSDDSVMHLCRMAKLRSINFSGCCKITWNSPAHNLDLAVFQAEYADQLNGPTSLPTTLQALELGFCKSLTMESLMRMLETPFERLSRVRIQTQHLRITDPFIEQLVKACSSHIKELQLYPCVLGSRAMMAISTCHQLETLHLAGVWNEASDEALVAVIQNCRNLRSLGIAKLGERASDAAFVACASLPNLEMLDLNHHALTPQGLVNFAASGPAVPNLRSLSLRFCKNITNECLVEFAKYARSLRTLDLSKSAISMDGVRGVLNVAKRLDYISVEGLGFNFRDIAVLGEQYPKVKFNM